MTAVRESSAELRRRTEAASALSGLVMSICVAALLAAADVDQWRVIGVVVALGIALTTSTALATRDDGASRIARGVIPALTHGICVALTGGLESPLTIVLPAVLAAPLFDALGVKARWSYLALAIAIVAGVAALPFGVAIGGAPTGPTRPLLAIVAIAWAVLVVRGLASRIEAQQGRAATAMDRLRDEKVQDALAQARRLQSVGAKVAHELKNPLAAIKGLVQLVDRAPDDARHKERIEVLTGEIARMEQILTDYLSYSRPLEDLVPAPVELKQLVSDVVIALSARAETGGVRLEGSGDAPVVQADRRRIKEALINLVSNAIEATPSGGKVKVVLAADGEHGAALEVIDTGAGISDADLLRLGQSFFTTREGGTGLGFVLARNAVTQHGGTLEVKSRVGAGTTMRVCLPTTPKKEEAHG